MSAATVQPFERLPLAVFVKPDEAVREVADRIEALIRNRSPHDRPVVLGLATGSTPVRLYRELIRRHREENLSFAHVVTFNLDEYYGLPADHPESYRRFMREQLFDHIDLPADHAHVPDGTVPRDQVPGYCQRFEAMIAQAGGIDLQVLGIGRTGHIGFNEPGSSPQSRTRLVNLDPLTRRDAARDFRGEANVPTHAITMGIGTILDAREVCLMAWGRAKADVIARATEDAPDDALPASFLQAHTNARFLVDDAAAAALTRRRLPWKVGLVDWTPQRIREAVTWLSQACAKPVLKLVEEDYTANYLADLLLHCGPAYNLNIRIFNELQHTLTGWPGGKPDVDDTNRPERAAPHPKRVVVLTPEPGEEIFGMGGTLSRLSDQGHHVQVLCLSSGNLSVPDEEARVGADLLGEFADDSSARRLQQILQTKTPEAEDPAELRQLKGRIRRGEARAALRLCGLPSERIHFLDMPFYETGRYRQFHPTGDDLQRLSEALHAARPHQIFLTGHQSDPASLAGVCFELLRQAYTRLEATWKQDCRLWLYPSPGLEPGPANVEMAVPLSPDELRNKTHAGYQHRSQRSQMPGGGEGLQDEWSIACEGNRRLAIAYDHLGLAEYEAIEPFQRLNL